MDPRSKLANSAFAELSAKDRKHGEFGRCSSFLIDINIYIRI